MSDHNLMSQCNWSFCFLVADLISFPVLKTKDLAFQRLIQNQPTLPTTQHCVYAVLRLSNGLVYLSGRSDSLYVNKPNTLLLTETQTERKSRRKSDKWINQKDRERLRKEKEHREICLSGMVE